MADIKITLETLYDILRNEKKKEDLQKLEESFYNDVVNYLKEKKSLLAQKSSTESIFSVGETEKLEYELRSIQRILKEIYEKREKKIIDIALNKSRTGSDIIDTSAMLREEKQFYSNTLDTLNKYRYGILFNLFKAELPLLDKVDRIEVKKPEEKKIEKKESEQSKIRIRFMHPVPSFVWKDMNVYGPFDIGEETEIFPEVADLLVRKGRAEKLS